MSDYAAICQSYTTERPNAIVFAVDNSYGKTFSDWAPFFAQDYGIEMLENQTFTTSNDIYTHLHDMSDESEVGDAFDMASASFIAVEDTKMLYDIARVRRKLIVDYYGTPMFASDDPFAVENDAYWQLFNSIYRTYFAFSGLIEESLAALGPDGRKMLQGYQGFSPYADPTTGFELSYQTRFGVMPTFAECKFYDALMLAGFAACYVEHNEELRMKNEESSFNNAIVTITSTDNAPMGGSAWNVTPMQVYLSATEGGQLYRFSGASGDISFDRDTYTAATTTTYVHWQIMDGEILHRSYFGSKGGARTTDASAAWLYLYNEKRASDDFMQQAGEGTDQHFAYPALTGQYAVLVQGSNGFDNYRHQADVLSIYQSLRRGGYPDDHMFENEKVVQEGGANATSGIFSSLASGLSAIGGIAANQISTQASYAFLMANGGSAGAGGVINPIKMWGGYACSIASGLFSFLGNQLQDQVTTKTTPGKIDLTIDASIALNGYLKEFTGNNQSTLSVSAEGIYTANGESGHVGKGVWGLEEDPVVYIDKDDIISTQNNFNVGCTEDGYTNSTFADYDVRIVYAFDPTSVKINLNEDLFKGIDSVTVTTNVGVIPNLRYGNTDEYRKMLMLGDKTKKYARPSFSLAEGKTSGTLELSGRSMPVVTKVGLDELADGDYETAENCTIVTQKTSDGKGWQRFHGRLIDASSKQIIVDPQVYIPYSTDDDGKCTGIGIPTAPDFVVRVEVGFSAFGRQSESQALPLQQTLYSEGRSG